MKYEIYIKTGYLAYYWDKLDLGEFAPALNFEANNIAKLDDTVANYSQITKIPATPNNARIFGHAHIPEVHTMEAYKTFDCMVLCDGIQILGGESDLVLLSYSGGEYEIQIIGRELKTLQKLYGLKFKSEGEYKAPNLNLGRAYVGYYPSVRNDYEGAPQPPQISEGVEIPFLVAAATLSHEVPGRRAAPHRYPTPAVKVSRMIKEIEKHTGLTINFAPALENDKLATLVNGGEADADSLTGYLTTLMLGAVNSEGYAQISDIEFQEPGGLFRWQYTDFTTPDKTRVHAEIPFNGRVVYSAHNTTNRVITLEITPAGGDTTRYRASVGSKIEFDIPTGDDVTIRARVEAGSTAPTMYLRPEYCEYSSGQVDSVGSFDIQRNLGFEDAAEYITELCKALGRFIDVKGDTITLFDITEVRRRQSSAPDWSARLVTEGVKKTFALKGYANNNHIKFEDNKKLPYTDAINLEIGDRTLAQDKELFKMNFVATTNVDVLYRYLINGTEQTATQPAVTTATYEVGGQFAGILEISKVGSDKPMIVEIQQHNKAVVRGSRGNSWREEYNRATSVTGAYLLERYYKPLLDGFLYRAHSFEADFMLRPLDILAFDPVTPVYVDRLGGYFYVNKISNFVANMPVKVELVAIRPII